MKTDSIFYRLFQTFPTAFFELINLQASEAKKIEILEILGQPLHHPQFLVNPEDLYVNSNVELRKIKEDWWNNNPIEFS